MEDNLFFNIEKDVADSRNIFWPIFSDLRKNLVLDFFDLATEGNKEEVMQMLLEVINKIVPILMDAIIGFYKPIREVMRKKKLEVRDFVLG